MTLLLHTRLGSHTPRVKPTRCRRPDSYGGCHPTAGRCRPTAARASRLRAPAAAASEPRLLRGTCAGDSVVPAGVLLRRRTRRAPRRPPGRTARPNSPGGPATRPAGGERPAHRCPWQHRPAGRSVPAPDPARPRGQRLARRHRRSPRRRLCDAARCAGPSRRARDPGVWPRRRPRRRPRSSIRPTSTNRSSTVAGDVVRDPPLAQRGCRARPVDGPLRSAAAGRSPWPPPPDHRARPPDGRRVLRVAARSDPLIHSTRWAPMPRRRRCERHCRTIERALHCSSAAAPLSGGGTADRASSRLPASSDRSSAARSRDSMRCEPRGQFGDAGRPHAVAESILGPPVRRWAGTARRCVVPPRRIRSRPAPAPARPDRSGHRPRASP